MKYARRKINDYKTKDIHQGKVGRFWEKERNVRPNCYATTSRGRSLQKKCLTTRKKIS